MVAAIGASCMAAANKNSRIFAIHFFGEHDLIGRTQLSKIWNDLIIVPHAG